MSRNGYRCRTLSRPFDKIRQILSNTAFQFRYNGSMFPERLKLLRKQYALTQKELGEVLGLTVSTVCDWERRRSEPNLKQLALLVGIFGVTADFLLGLPEEA